MSNYAHSKLKFNFKKIFIINMIGMKPLNEANNYVNCHKFHHNSSLRCTVIIFSC